MSSASPVDDWMFEAERDLAAAGWLIEGKFYDRSIFNSEQAAEKAVKALYLAVHGGNAPPKTHRVDSMAAELGAAPDILGKATRLSMEYTVARYPGAVLPLPSIAYTQPVAEDRLEDARLVVDWAKEMISRARHK